MISVCSYESLIRLATNLIIKIEIEKQYRFTYSYIIGAMKLLNRSIIYVL